jgi:hypothetical protein
MSDMLAVGASWLADRLATSAGRTVRYVRGATTAYLTATVGSSVFEAADQNGVVERWESRDFVIKTSSFPLGVPQRHDRVVDTQSGSDVTYEVAAPRGIPVWRYGDGFRATMRVHTKAVADDTATSPTLLVRWWGASTATAITDGQITSQLTSDMADGRAQTRTIVASAAYLHVVLPASFGSPTFTVGGLVNSAWETTTRSITFTGQAARSYTIYRSTYAITGTVVVVVS